MKTFRQILLPAVAVGVFSIAASAQASLPSIQGGNIDVQAQKGKVVILAYGASWLPLSDKQADYTNALAKKYSGKNVAVYFVATDSTNPKSKNFATNDRLAKFANETNLKVPILRDSEGLLTLKKLGIDQLPSFVVLDKSGARSGAIFGGIDPKFDITITISKKVDSLL